MNTNNIKKFAQQARKKLIEQITAKLQQVLHTDSAELREKVGALHKLQQAINATSKEQVIDKVAYTWFNRLMALRFMDANDYQPIGIRIVTPKDGHTLPEILDEAKQGNIPDELPVKPQHIYDLLDGKIPAANPQNEAYKELLIGACNHLNKVFPFLFERIDDYAEVLLPDDLTSEFSIVHDMHEGMTTEDCKQVEIIGWLYQFYISERKDEVFASKNKVSKEDIPAATQLFTPRWIVEYMVQNTVGKLWLQNKPNSKLREHMPYFIESPSVTSEDYLKVSSIEEITLLDQACGSGHILVYGFELFAKIYEEEGYNPSEIPQLIIENNLHGFEIDERAAQLAGMALMMKARTYQRRVFRKEIEPNILCYKDLSLTDDEIIDIFQQSGIKLSDELSHDLTNMQQATNLGSLIKPHATPLELETTLARVNGKVNTSDAFLNHNLKQIQQALVQLLKLSNKYHSAVTNPPYMGGGKMNSELSAWVKVNYPKSKADLFSCFIERSIAIVPENGFNGLITMESWMFLSSFEEFRKEMLVKTVIDRLIHMPYLGKGGTSMGINFGTSAIILIKRIPEFDTKGQYQCIRYYETDEKGVPYHFPTRNERYNIANQKNFEKIPGSPIGYWLSENVLDVFIYNRLDEVAEPRLGMATADNNRFLRFSWENKINNICINDPIEESKGFKKWFKYAKGGVFRKWYGNLEYIVDWEKDGYNIKNFTDNKGNVRSHNYNLDYVFKKGITWNALSSINTSFRTLNNSLFDNAGSSLFLKTEVTISYYSLLGFLNSKIVSFILPVINPTLNYQPGTIGKIPIGLDKFTSDYIVKDNINISNNEWDTRETSWNFNQNELLRIKGQDIEESYNLYKQYWKNKFFQLHQNEEELNRQFIEIYGLQEELTPDVPLEDITILKEETKIVNNELVFNAKEVFAQFVSYAVGCMFGRYSLDKPGLILANQGETLEDYLAVISTPAVISSETTAGSDEKSPKHNPQNHAVISKEAESNEAMRNPQSNTQLSPSGGGRGRFLPDDDNIIPILNDEWFEDDITGRFHEFLVVTFGKHNFEKNLHFIEDALGKDIRKYFAKDFYPDHIKRYKKRPIYWMFSSPKGNFNVLIYMHRYNQDTLSQILNGYLVEYREKLNTHMEHLDHQIETGTSSEQTKASKEKDKLKLVLMELQEYERDTLYPLATERISIDLDDGVLVNYNKFGKAIKPVAGLNDAKTKTKVMGFDWIDNSLIK